MGEFILGIVIGIVIGVLIMKEFTVSSKDYRWMSDLADRAVDKESEAIFAWDAIYKELEKKNLEILILQNVIDRKISNEQ